MNTRSHILTLIAVSCAVIGFGGLYHTYTHPSLPITDFVYSRDAQDIFEIFDKNWYWLMPQPKEEYHPGYVRYVFEHKAPQANPMHHNKLIIKVLHIDKQLAGFVAYHMKSKETGMLLFLAVKEEFRGKKYGELLTRYALKDLIHHGAKQINLVTRVDNIPAQRIYTSLGFREIMNDGEGFVYFVYDPHAGDEQHKCAPGFLEN
jgi:ribosomal protein S18 acetylase RimI-like enzyme